MKFSTCTTPLAMARLSLLALAAIACSSTWADDSGWYAGVNIGQTRATIDDARIASGLLQSGLTSLSITDDNRSGGYRVLGGYQFNKNLALEGGYFDLGHFGFVANTVPTGRLTGDIALRGINLDAVATLPITAKLSVMGRIGAIHTEAKDSFTGSGVVQVMTPNPSSRSNNLKVGLGLQYALTEQLLVRAELERYRIDDAVGNKGDVDILSLGLIYRFGTQTPARLANTVATAPSTP